MVYTELTEKAMKLAYTAHRGQTDRGGIPYIFHPIHIAEQMDSEYEICTALLHDVIEDTKYTVEDLEYWGFPAEVIWAVRLLTHTKDTDYDTYIKAIGLDDIARKVKIADLKHNSDLTRLKVITDKDLQRKEKYLKCVKILEKM